MGDETADDEVAPGPIFCQNCGKKLPAAANFCPGCGNRISSHKEKQKPRAQEREAHTPDSTGSQRGEAGSSRSGKTPVKKGPKGSEMTILHKFLRR
jgi:hypothetical protein